MMRNHTSQGIQGTTAVGMRNVKSAEALRTAAAAAQLQLCDVVGASASGLADTQ
jgi:hypothetical protein